MNRTSNDVMPAIDVRGVNHFYGSGDSQKQVLHDNDLQVKPGEIVIMTGQSGSGKTTLLTLIGTLRRVQQGELWVLGQPLHNVRSTDPSALAVSELDTAGDTPVSAVLRRRYDYGSVPQANLQAIRKRLGFIFQAHNLFTSLTALQNVR
ncbi:MAG: ATP-binding cassette domain-containing protein, partial [Planctomycetota bacterium]